MPTLLETQRAFARAIVAAKIGDIAPVVAAGEFAPAERLDVYRNTFLSSVTNALRLSYPAVYRLVGEEFFDGAAQCFIESEPPKSAYLNLYGARFGDFLAAFQPAASLPYLADVARVEWAVNCALHAPDAKPLDAQAFAAAAIYPPERLALMLHPSIALLSADYPADAIWRAVLGEDDDALGRLDASASMLWLLVERTAHGVEVTRLEESEWRFLSALREGHSLAEAISRAERCANLPAALAAHIAAGRFAGCREKIS